MRYCSTRGDAPVLGFDEVLLTGLASDGGLYLPEAWPHFSAADLDELAGLPYPELAARIMRPFVVGSVVAERFDLLVAEAYAGFEHAAVTPLKQLDARLWLLELFHGPTLAFKDVALQLLGLLFDAILSARGQRLTIVGATSGDTGSAAIEACRDRAHVEIFMLHPKGRTSEVQRRQMTTVQAANVHNIAIEGSFDDCQDLVKALFNDRGFRAELPLSAVNSINWARVMAQIVYYFAAGLALGAIGPGGRRPLAFVVPTGNFGNVFAGYAAKRMGLPIETLVVASNANDILARFFETGALAMETVVPTLSPSMDIQVSSNFERLLFEAADRDGALVRSLLDRFREARRVELGEQLWQAIRSDFQGFRLDDAGTLAEMALRRQESGELIDPHSAVGTAAARSLELDRRLPVVALGTAHPAKFPDAVEKATGERPPLPPRLADLYERPERFEVLPADTEVLKAHIRSRSALAGAAA
ncbi:L-threonine synthase [Tistlia consotensis]|uniref:Threonine synthase n=1 Tax=Tistlia consotensis USBA 355 TaxID=560819 RepID=A0A1Y6BBK3_9PROT|nr:threonine synthase [Tistlia consotensis]SME94587.1 L-threonine synthase [Tistlia consotensis USBA 355]SNR29444.1 L-threonine synthase [Tistlia consotensis]